MGRHDTLSRVDQKAPGIAAVAVENVGKPTCPLEAVALFVSAPAIRLLAGSGLEF